jgi:hypothetical protein
MILLTKCIATITLVVAIFPGNSSLWAIIYTFEPENIYRFYQIDALLGSPLWEPRNHYFPLEL